MSNDPCNASENYYNEEECEAHERQVDYLIEQNIKAQAQAQDKQMQINGVKSGLIDIINVYLIPKVKQFEQQLNAEINAKIQSEVQAIQSQIHALEAQANNLDIQLRHLLQTGQITQEVYNQKIGELKVNLNSQLIPLQHSITSEKIIEIKQKLVSTALMNNPNIH
jgi:hypothetical protein